jgi:repressor of nif and glnA expression
VTVSLDEILQADEEEQPIAAGAGATVHLTTEDAEILRALADAHPVLQTQEEIEGATRKRKGGQYVAVRTIRRRLPILKRKGLVCQPEGKRSGWGLTEAGLKAAKPRE